MSSLPESHEQAITGVTIILPARKYDEIRVGPYRLINKLGAGGMGEVYLAEDARLGRNIALKMLPAQFTQDAYRVRRFVREAKAASALNHPNIITIFDIGEADGDNYIATEYIQGQTLRQQMLAPVTIAMALNVGIQMASALNAAHEAGIIHRDIKPENIMLRPDGLVKILDFGIAKLIERHAAADSENQEMQALNEYATMFDPNLSTPEWKTEGTAPGIILGTVTYMSPEQLRGQKIDARSDIFSLGIVLYEVIVGTPPFSGLSQADKIAAILEHEPEPLTDHQPDAPPELERIVSKALRKDRDSRYQYVKDMLADLKALKEELEFQQKLERSGQDGAHDHLHVTKTFRRQRWRLVIATAAVVVVMGMALVVASLYWGSHHPVPLTDKDTVVLADFINTTGDPVFDATLRQGLASQLEQSPFLKLLSDDRIAQALSLIAKPKDARLTQQLACQVCQRTASKATIEGSISGLGSHYELQLQAVDCRSGDVLVEIRATADGKQEVLKQLGKAAANLRERLGESLALVQKYDAPVEHVTTGSLEALQAYSLGYKSHVKADFAGATPLLERAVSLDPNFAMAYSRLAANYSTIGDTVRTVENSRKAYELRQRVSERERFYIESNYQSNVIEKVEVARKIYELWAQTYPRDSAPRNGLRNIYSILGEHEKGLLAIQESLRLDPGNATGFANLISSYIALNRLDEASVAIQEAQSQNLDSPNIHARMYLICFLQNDSAGMEREATLLINKPGWESFALYLESETAACMGKFSRARELARRVIDSLQLAGKKEAASSFQAQAALREALAGNLTLARHQAEHALRLSDNKYVQAVSAIALGLVGDSAKATRLADYLAQHFPENTSLQFHYLPMIRGAVAMQGGNSAKAIEALAVAAPYEMGIPKNIHLLTLYPVYLRGQVYLAAHQGASAAALFQKILDHPGLVGNELIGALAHLGLARAYAIAGDATRARTAYQDFLVLWKDADPHIPILRQARAEYGQLG